ELKGTGMPRIWPCAAGAVKALGLVHRQQRSGAFELDALLAQRSRSGMQGAPTASRSVKGGEHGLFSQPKIRSIGWRRRDVRLLGHDRSTGNRNTALPARRCGEDMSLGGRDLVVRRYGRIASNTPSRRTSAWKSAAATCNRTKAKNTKAR